MSPERPVGRDEHDVRVVEPERREIDEQVMPVGHGQGHFRDVGKRRQSRRAHRVQRMLDRSAVVRRERVKQRRADPLARGKIRRARTIRPRRRHRGREDAVVGLRKRRELVAGEAGKPGVCRLQHHEIGHARGHDGGAARVAHDEGGPLLTSRLNERMRVGAATGRQALPPLFGRGHAHAIDERPAGEMLGQAQKERFDVVDRIVPRKRVHGVLHRVGRETPGVLSLHVHRRERAFELHVDREVDDAVRLSVVVALRPAHLHETDPGLPVAIPAEGHQDPRYVE